MQIYIQETIRKELFHLLIKGGAVWGESKITIAVQIKEKKSYNTFFYKAIKGFERMEIGRHFFLNHLNNQKKKKSAFTDGSVA